MISCTGSATSKELRRALQFRDLLAYRLIFMVPIAPMAIFDTVFSTSGGMVVLAYAIGPGTGIRRQF